MKLTSKQLKRIIKEELNKITNEANVGPGSFMPDEEDERVATAAVRDFTGVDDAEREKEDFGDLEPADPREVYDVDFMRRVAYEIAQAGQGDINKVSDGMIDKILRKAMEQQG